MYGTVEPLIKDLPRVGHNRNSHSTKDTLRFQIVYNIHFKPLRQPLCKGQNVPTCHLFIVHKAPMYNLSIIIIYYV